MSECTHAIQTGRELLEPRYIGVGDERLFVCHHSPLARQGPSRAVALCYPTGHEYERCHRAVRQLAAHLADAGFDVLRFDYSCTGDSGGESTAASLDAWRRDIGVAIDHLQGETGTARVALVGLRLGASLALQVAATRDDVTELVLWSPAFSGTALLKEWTAAQHLFEAGLGHPASPFPPTEVFGYPLPVLMSEELLRTELPVRPRRVERMQLIVHETGGGNVQALEHLRRYVPGLVVHEAAGDTPWLQDTGQALVPAQVLRAIVAFLTAGP